MGFGVVGLCWVEIDKPYKNLHKTTRKTESEVIAHHTKPVAFVFSGFYIKRRIPLVLEVVTTSFNGGYISRGKNKNLSK